MYLGRITILELDRYYSVHKTIRLYFCFVCKIKKNYLCIAAKMEIEERYGQKYSENSYR